MSSSNVQRAFVFAGGGTGGHLYPGVAIAERLREGDPSALTLFICSDKPLDRTILDAEGLVSLPIPARPLAARPRAVLALARNWGACVRSVRIAIRDLQKRAESVQLIAMGGYVSAPAAIAARSLGVPIALVNLDAAPGKANRWIARVAGRIFTAADAGPPSWERIRPIVRRGAVPAAPPAECRRRLGLSPDLPTLFVTGASQGARSINELLIGFVQARPEALRGWQVFHQTGQADARDWPREVREAYQQAGIPAVVAPFCGHMASAWGAADLAVSRAGAGSVAEAWASGTPTLFLPYPHHRDHHQRQNAAPLAQAGAAEVVEDLVSPEVNMGVAGEALARLLGDADRREAMKRAFAALGPADGAERVAAALLHGA